MSKKIVYFLLRLNMGWLMLYAGVTKILDPKWTAKGYIANAKTFPELYKWLASDNILPIINFLNEWGLTLIGVSIIIGFFVRISSVFGGLLMLLYYFPVLKFPYAGQFSYIVDEHIIYALVFVFFIVMDVGRYWGLDSYRITKR